VDDRERLAETSWELIKQNPLLGDVFFLGKMEHMRQGEGFFDLVNVYASITLLYGAVGLFLFLAPFLLGAITTWRVSRKTLCADVNLPLLGAPILACMLPPCQNDLLHLPLIV
jgi:hypothetical protein